MIERMRRQTIGDTLRRSRLRHPDKLALKWKNTELTYRELDEKVNQLANRLLESGIKKGERVAILATNCLDFVLAHYGISRTGAIGVPINFMLKPHEVRYILEHCEPVALFATPNCFETAETASEGFSNVRLKVLLDTEEAKPGWETLGQWVEGQSVQEPETEIDDTDVVNILYTSGTESRPKGVMLTHQNLVTEYVSCIVDFYFDREDRLIHALPLFHSAQLHAFLGPSLYLGSSGVIIESPQPQLLMEILSREKVTQFFCPPTVWVAMIRHPDFRPEYLSALRKCYFGASATPMEVLKEAGKMLPQVRFWNTYGQTEVAPFATVLQPEEQFEKIGTVGRPCLNMETKVVDESDCEVPPGTLGEIVHRSPHVMAGYFHDEEKSKAAFAKEWFHTGDLGFFDDDGYLTVVDRKKDMIKTGGENVASLEVEEVLYQHPYVNEVSVIGVPHPHWTEAVTAVIIGRQNVKVKEEELRDFCKERLAAFKVPKFFVMAEDLPRNPSGKILKRELREQYKGLADKIET
ncbi:MAG TPA: fatty acyl-CoA synthetase [Bacillales bacterium]|nr:fatty acyl-CoA synthetase [Bacillales bacterium]